MAGTDRGTPLDLGLDIKLSLLKRGKEFSFFQAVRLLRLYLNAPSSADASLPYGHDQLHIVPHLSLAFPASDIESIEEETSPEENNSFRIQANFLSLYGASSPLPVFYTEELLAEASEEESASRDFLDIIHQRLYLLFFQSWLKYRQFQQVYEEQDSSHIDRLFCLLGLGEPEFREHVKDAPSLLRYTGLFSQAPRSAQGLKTLLTDSLNLPVDIISCLKRKAKIPEDQRIRLGADEVGLGNDSFLGEEIDDRMGKFRIKIGPLDEPNYRALFPGSALYNKVVMLTDLFVTDPLEYDIEVTMAGQQAKTVCLGGEQWSRLGLDSWLSSEEYIGEKSNLFTPAGP
ncbi:MAG: type VI secretion system baseplate subunit TssG [Candidatus Electrothrix communis]|nr:MAG: type VI secretion system baseplate subunit TssG [Candidatus Electrothrix communis]